MVRTNEELCVRDTSTPNQAHWQALSYNQGQSGLNLPYHHATRYALSVLSCLQAQRNGRQCHTESLPMPRGILLQVSP